MLNTYLFLAAFVVTEIVVVESSLEPYLGIEYTLTESKNLEDLLRALKVNQAKILVATKANTEIKLTKNNGKYTLRTEGKLLWSTKTEQLEFTMSKPFKYNTLDGRHTTCTFTEDGNKLIQVLEDEAVGGKTMTITKEFTDQQVISTTVYGDITSVRNYTKKK